MNPTLFREYAPEINDLLNDCAGMGVFYPKYYGFSWSNLMNPLGEFYNGVGAVALTSLNSTSPKPLNFVTKPGESFICTTIYVSWSAVAGGGAVAAPPSIGLKSSSGKKFIDSNTSMNFDQNQNYVPLTLLGGPGYIDGSAQNSLYYPAPFRYVFNAYETITAEALHPGGNDMNVYLTLMGLAVEVV